VFNPTIVIVVSKNYSIVICDIFSTVFLDNKRSAVFQEGPHRIPSDPDSIIEMGFIRPDPLHGQESGDLVDERLVIMLDRLRSESGWPMVIHWRVGGAVDLDGSHGHSAKSYHLASRGCKAVDSHFETDAPHRFQYYKVSLVGFTGIGFYPEWRPVPGLHVDLRPMNLTQRWTLRNGEYLYLL